MRSEPTTVDKAVKLLQGVDSLRRVWIVQRDDGVYVLKPEEWYQNVIDGELVAEGWKPIYGEYGLFGGADLAERDALVRFAWLKETQNPAL
ncbi:MULTISPECIES: hypothetical protein [unclassified Ensifer]|uniref:hypothetical protein n=1 Tax=unclassified Ensifer TaxID=2633371 RepID=UPI000DD7AB28|nr:MULTISPECIES: hypothetical protein [unclassified Ensifer]MBD9494434.1 hypothetical protein [Ensifer sp. ENS01]MBD9518466.1 hypothetical protein [Ensifer sp. ENS02]MCY1743783.1 hypothetical protein [Ensifer sp. SL37]